MEQTAIEKSNEFISAIAQKNEQYKELTISGLDDKQGYKVVDDARKDIKAIRVQIEKLFKSERDVLNVAVKSNLAKEKEVLALVEPIENQLIEKLKVVDDEKKRVEELKAAEEKQKIDARFERINRLGLTFNGSDYLGFDKRISAAEISTMADIQFEQIISEFEQLKHEADEKKRLEAEQEAKRLAEVEEANRKEAERLRAIKAEQERVAAEQAAAAQKLKEEQEAVQAEKNRLRLEEERRQAKIQQDAAVEAARKEGEERAKKDAEEKRIADEKAKADAEVKAKKEADEKAAAEKLEAERKERLRPDKEKLIEMADNLWYNVPAPTHLESEEAKAIIPKVKVMYDKIADFIKQEANSL